MSVERNVKYIDCPAHPGKHQAELFCYPHSLAGIWGCPVTGESDSHDHSDEDTITEMVENWPTHAEDMIFETPVEYYAICGVPVNE